VDLSRSRKSHRLLNGCECRIDTFSSGFRFVHRWYSRVRNEVVISNEQIKIFRMNEQFLPSLDALFQHTNFDQFLQILRSRLPFRDARVHNILNPAVRQLENQAQQLVTVNLRPLTTEVLSRLVHQLTDRLDLGPRPISGFQDALDQKNQPAFPIAFRGYVLQQTVIIRAILNDVTAEIENW
jgi:hypothetical protein